MGKNVNQLLTFKIIYRFSSFFMAKTLTDLKNHGIKMIHDYSGFIEARGDEFSAFLTLVQL